MTFSSTAGAGDPDPTTQMRWPSSRWSDEPSSPVEFRPPLTSVLPNEARTAALPNSGSRDPKQADELVEEIGKRRLTTWNLFCLSVSMAGAQVAWTVELGYGTPFLLSLGLSEKLTSLVWLAGPISGLIAQPVIGAISDSSISRYRRRYWVVTSTVVLVASALVLAYCKELAGLLVNIFSTRVDDWDPHAKKKVASVAIGLAVAAFYMLDFSLNALQASLRNLLLDITPPSQLNSGNAWHGRMTHAGNIIGYGFGFLPLAQLPILRLLGGSQFRKFCVVAMTILIVTVAITCFTQEEKTRQRDFRSGRSRFVDVILNIWKAIVNLPKPIRRVCYVQLFAYMGWFPFLFYSTTYVGQVLATELNREPDAESATRMGSVALLCFSIVAVIAGSLLPSLARRDLRLLGKDYEEEEEDAEMAEVRNLVRQWRAEAARKGEPLKLPTMPFMLRNIWTAALAFFFLLTFSTFFITTVFQAIIAISLIGICWAVACWVPFAIIMEFLKEMEQDSLKKRAPPTAYTAATGSSRNHARSSSSPSIFLFRAQNAFDERQSLLRRQSLGPHTESLDVAEDMPVPGGTVLGIHNLAIVMPQFLVAVASSTIFRFTEDPNNENTYLGKTGVAWVLRFGGLCALFGAAVARKVPPTKTEKEMRRRLGEMEVLKEQRNP